MKFAPCRAIVLGAVALAGITGEVPSRADEVLSVQEAAKRIGETVTFEGEVVSVPSSPRRAAVYMNFGDAYPWQTLSVLFADDYIDILTNFPSLRGKTVRVTGKVGATRKGPVIVITNAAQVHIVRTIKFASLDEEGDGHAFRRRIGATLLTLFSSGDYDTLEQVSTQWQAGRERFKDGHWKLQTFYESLMPANIGDDAAREKFFARTASWKQAHPNSTAPYILNASALISYGWKARGNGYVYTVTEEGWRLLAERLAMARSELEAVRDRRATCPHWFLVMQRLALGQGWTRAEYDALFDEAMANEPEYHFYCYEKARYLQTKWHGEPGEWEAFAKSLVSRYPDGLGEMLYTLTVWNMRRDVGLALKAKGLNYFQETDIEWPLCKAGFERLRRKYPDSMWILNNYALYAGRAGDRETLGRLLVEIDDRCDMSLWVTWENVALARLWAAGKEPPGATLSLFR